jgi:N-acetylglucosamine malate deacetylase 2
LVLDFTKAVLLKISKKGLRASFLFVKELLRWDDKLLLIITGLFYFRSMIQDEDVLQTESLIPDNLPKKALAIFAHPDDEITIIGTMRMLKSQGVETGICYMTRGEAGLNGSIIDVSKIKELADTSLNKLKKALGQRRTKEVDNIASILELNHHEMFDFPDSGTSDVSMDSLKKVVRSLIQKYRPSVLFTLDDKVGLYGHPDHRNVSKAVLEVFEEDKGKANFSPKKLYQVTLPKDMITFALKMAEGFRKNYPKDPAKGLPQADVCVNITPFGHYKRDCMLAHVSQRPTFDDMQPGFATLPPWLYFRVFDREYFHVIE